MVSSGADCPWKALQSFLDVQVIILVRQVLGLLCFNGKTLVLVQWDCLQWNKACSKTVLLATFTWTREKCMRSWYASVLLSMLGTKFCLNEIYMLPMVDISPTHTPICGFLVWKLFCAVINEWDRIAKKSKVFKPVQRGLHRYVH